jgi:ABC-type Mn2+/Zn2+ transport system ATPase subunit
MTERRTKAQFWKCALQVNPAACIKYRGAAHGMTEEQYNTKLVEVARANGIKIIGLADHGNVAGVDAIRAAMNKYGILVFPGFEIASTEKAHFVCLFPEDTTRDQLNRYLGALGLTNPAHGVWPSNFGGNDLLQKVEELGGFIYAAHCTDASGVLRQELVHVWQNPLLKAVQIPGTLNDLKNNEGNAHRQLLSNKDQAYGRELETGIINAMDVAEPDDLANPKASCLIKMTQPCFASFKLAFQDPESRVCLNSESAERYYSRIERLTITGGYLDGVEIEFSEHLNAVIGGRGTGKSTLVECIRYALNVRPIGKTAQKQHDEIIRENLGKSRARIELLIRSSKMNGRCFILARSYGESTSVSDENGNPSAFTPADLLPDIEIYGQNEIYEIAQDPGCQRKLLSRFLEPEQPDSEAIIHLALRKLAENRQKLLESQGKIATIEDEVARLAKLEEQVGQFKNPGLEEKLKIVPLLETEKHLLKRVLEEEGPNLDHAFQTVRDNLPDTVFLNAASLEKLPHTEPLRLLKSALDGLYVETENLLSQWQGHYTVAKETIETLAQELTAAIQHEEAILEQTFKDIPSSEGKTGKQMGLEFQSLLKEIERIRPKIAAMETQKKLSAELQRQRKSILDELSATRANRSARFSRAVKKLNKHLAGNLRLEVKPESDRKPIIDYLLGCKLEGVGEARLAWIKEADDFSPVKLAELIRTGADALRNAKWGMTATVADALVRLSADQILRIEELELPDVIHIELNTAHEGQENFRPLEKLSTGQQCTAILNLLLLQNLDPLIMDQPEDNLDNAFIADRIVAELRSAKISRQFIFATHNANIPVFGDAEWIGVLEVTDGQARMPVEAQGAIDIPDVREKAAVILEGGRAAFNQRKAKYGF